MMRPEASSQPESASITKPLFAGDLSGLESMLFNGRETVIHFVSGRAAV
jgi:hypothetical protein